MDRAIAEVEDALRRVGRPVTTGTTMTQLERRLGSHSPEVAAYLRALAAGRYALAPPPPAAGGPAGAAARAAQGLGFAGRLRALWALPPRLERAALALTLARGRHQRARARRERPGLTERLLAYVVSCARRDSPRISARMRSRRGSVLWSTCVIAAATAGWRSAIAVCIACATAR